MSVKIKTCFIGCGKTAIKHAKCMIKNNFEITHVTNSSNKKNLSNFAEMFKVKNVVNEKNKIFLHDKDIDAYVVVVPSNDLEFYAKKIIKLKKKALIEKPLSPNLSFLKKHRKNKNIMVGYNKRYYNSVIEAKKFVLKRTQYIANIVIPEDIKKFNLRDKKKFLISKHFTNSVHVFDMINFIFGEIKLIKTKVVKKNSRIYGYVSILQDKNSNIINIFSAWNSTENFSISINSNNENFKISPLEKAKIYSGFDIEITARNTKIYNPKVTGFYQDENTIYANGFFQQSKLFYSFIKNKKKSQVALINDALQAQELAYKVLKLN